MYDVPERNSFYQSLVWTVARRGPEVVIYYGGVLDFSVHGGSPSDLGWLGQGLTANLRGLLLSER